MHNGYVLGNLHFYLFKKPFYLAADMDLDGKNGVGGTCGAKTKAQNSEPNGLCGRSREDIVIACAGSLTDFADAIAAVFQETEI